MDRRLFLLAGAAGMCGCATGVWNLPSYETLPHDKSGLAIASVGGVWPGNPRISVGFRPIATPDTVGEFKFLRENAFGATPVDIQEGSRLGTVAAIRLPPGRYEITGAAVQMGGMIHYLTKPGKTFPFDIEAGKVSYLGEFMAQQVWGKNAIGMDSTTGFFVSVRNQLARDLALLRKRGVVVGDGQVLASVMTKDQSAQSIFVREPDQP